MKIRWTENAEDHLDLIFKYISKNSEEYAKRMVDRITYRSIQIGNFPFSGRKVPEYDNDKVREVIEGPYRIIYLIKTDQIDILAIMHGAQLLIKED